MEISLNKSQEELSRLENTPIASPKTLQENENPDLIIDTSVDTNILRPPPPPIKDSMSEEFFDSIEGELYMKSLREAVNILLTKVDAEKRYNIEISSNVKFILQTLTEDETVNYFDTVEDNLKQIIKDDQINANDIPYIIQPVSYTHLTLQTNREE